MVFHWILCCYHSFHWYSFAVIIDSCCTNGIPLDHLMLSFLPLIFHWFLHAASMVFHWILYCYHLSFLPLVFHWFLHAAAIPMVFHWFLCIIIDSIGIPLLLSLIHAASMVYSIGSFVVIIHSMLIPCYATEFKYECF